MKKISYQEILSKLKTILLKKSEGYFYNEEVLEYQKENNKQEEVQQINFLESNKNDENKTNKNLTLIKKKVTTHYVPPDLLAIKMLIEIFGKEITDNDLSSLSLDELNNLKTDIIKKLEEL